MLVPVQDAKQKREDLGVELYGFQQQLAKLQMQLEKSQEQHVQVSQVRAQPRLDQQTMLFVAWLPAVMAASNRPTVQERSCSRLCQRNTAAAERPDHQQGATMCLAAPQRGPHVIRQDSRGPACGKQHVPGCSVGYHTSVCEVLRWCLQVRTEAEARVQQLRTAQDEEQQLTAQEKRKVGPTSLLELFARQWAEQPVHLVQELEATLSTRKAFWARKTALC